MLFFTRNNIKNNKSVNKFNKSEKCIIPKNIYQTWYTLDLSPYLKECVENIKK